MSRSSYSMMPWRLTLLCIGLLTLVKPVNAQTTDIQQQENTAVQVEASQDEVAVKAILTKQVAAWNEGNLEKFMETYWNSPQLTFSGGGKTTRGWQATLDRYKNSYDTPEKMGQLKFDHLQFQQLTPQVALVLGQWHLTRTKDAPQGNFSLVLKSIDGAWKIVHDHSSTLEDPESGNDDNASDDQ